MEADAVTLRGPRDLSLRQLALRRPGDADVVVEVGHSSISTGTEKLFWEGRMPPFPGMAYPLVPGYEAAGEIVESGPLSPHRPGMFVFVPGADCYEGARGLFGGASRRMVTPAARVVRADPALGPDATLMALAATARHAMAGLRTAPPELIVGHGVLGRLLARLTLAAGAPAPTVWETDPGRRSGASGYGVIAPDEDARRDYGAVYDASGDATLLDGLIGRLAKGGEIVLAGFYAQPLSFAFPPAFMREARIRVSAEWAPDDLQAIRALVESGDLSLAGLITHHAPAADAPTAYRTAFTDPACLKMCLDWKGFA